MEPGPCENPADFGEFLQSAASNQDPVLEADSGLLAVWRTTIGGVLQRSVCTFNGDLTRCKSVGAWSAFSHVADGLNQPSGLNVQRADNGTIAFAVAEFTSGTYTSHVGICAPHPFTPNPAADCTTRADFHLSVLATSTGDVSATLFFSGNELFALSAGGFGSDDWKLYRCADRCDLLSSFTVAPLLPKTIFSVVNGGYMPFAKAPAGFFMVAAQGGMVELRRGLWSSR